MYGNWMSQAINPQPGNAPAPSVQPTAGISATVNPVAQPYMHPVHRLNQQPIPGGSNVFQRLAAMNASSQQPLAAYNNQMGRFFANQPGGAPMNANANNYIGVPRFADGSTEMDHGQMFNPAAYGNQIGNSFGRGKMPAQAGGFGGKGGPQTGKRTPLSSPGKGGGIGSLGGQIGGAMGAGYREQSQPGYWRGGYVRY